jgi:GMP synthase (glutamine-hydrolysing)
MPSLLVIQHAVSETIGSFSDVAAKGGIEVQCLEVYKTTKIPADLGPHSGLILMGGPMSVYEEDIYPFLGEERRLILNCLRANKPILGVCLGSQLLASALGARVTPAAGKEIGWKRVTLTEEGKLDPLLRGMPPVFPGFHWHGDVFNLPPGTTRLASSEMTECQAFRYRGNVYGLLFHPEVNEQTISAMAESLASELRIEGIEAASLLSTAKEVLPRLAPLMQELFSHWLALLA